jgi:hypothetical protein
MDALIGFESPIISLAGVLASNEKSERSLFNCLVISFALPLWSTLEWLPVVVVVVSAFVE